ncbi:YciI family protein [Symbioplanes lichenis]|uniref:YciI family protein n=1 Tax=Symbioplanes lichenis TaxID=1629072 RepID=UPI0027390B1A|nr:YciI family protein [Actinoplanes lichenis]
MRYTLLMHYTEQTPETLGAEAMAEGRRAMTDYTATLQQAGVLIAAEVLQPSAATTTVSRVGDELRIQDGPFADTKEQLGGTFVIDVPDLDAAIEWAGRVPAATWGTVEVRPGAMYVTDGVWRPNA